MAANLLNPGALGRRRRPFEMSVPAGIRRSARLDRYPPICSNAVVGRGRVLALDYGTRNVGLALCDELQITVSPLPSVPNRGLRKLLAQIRDSVEKRQIRQIVVGLPLNMDGSKGNAIQRVESFMARLRGVCDLPLLGVDERLSTVEATEIWRGMSPRQKRKYRTVDSLAAALILERYLKEL